MKFKIGDQVKIVGKSLGRPFSILKYSEGIISEIRGFADGSNENNCIVIAEIGDISPCDYDWFAPQDLIWIPHLTKIDKMFDELIEDL